MTVKASYTWNGRGARLAITDSIMTPLMEIGFLENPLIGTSFLSGHSGRIFILKTVS